LFSILLITQLYANKRDFRDVLNANNRAYVFSSIKDGYEFTISIHLSNFP